MIPKDVSVTSPNMNAAQFGPISLDKYKGQTIYVALVYQGDNAHKWYVDDVEIRELAPWVPLPAMSPLIWASCSTMPT